MPEDKWQHVQGKFDYFVLYINVLHIFKGASPAFVMEVMDEWEKHVVALPIPLERAPDEDLPVGLCIAAATSYEPPAAEPDPEENSNQPQQPPTVPDQGLALPDPTPNNNTPDIDNDDAPIDNE
uniref:Uncharacterized protein n=2 Tax=Moniliophthora roreri TaxID=221103 RepID=A0A0W0GB62_MONRR